jgi:hypothetical protein
MPLSSVIHVDVVVDGDGDGDEAARDRRILR